MTMSEASLWNELWKDEVHKCNRLMDRLCEKHMKLISCESQRFTLLAHLKLAGKELETARPYFSAWIANVIQQLESTYEVETSAIRSIRKTETNQKSDVGSQISETSLSMGEADGMPESA